MGWLLIGFGVSRVGVLVLALELGGGWLAVMFHVVSQGLDLPELLALSAPVFGDKISGGADALIDFIYDRLAGSLREQGYSAQEVDAVLALKPARLAEVARRLAHEIKNPLTPIQLAAERLQHKLGAHLAAADADMLERSTRTIVNQVQAMKTMVDSFRDYARLPPAKLIALDLNDLLRDMLVLYEASSTPIRIALAEDLPCIKGDPTQLRQIIHNLIRNSQDATEGVGDLQIEVSTRRSGKQVELVIADTGPGFPAEIMANAFEPYVTTKLKGTGLGLPIVKKIIEEHGGKISLANRDTGGAEIRILLQAADDLEAPSHESPKWVGV